VVTIDYDPMLGKLVVSGADRAQAIERTSRALDEYEIAGVETTLPLFRALVRDPDFRAARFHTQWLDEWLSAHTLDPPDATFEEAAFAAACLSAERGAATVRRTGAGSRWSEAARRESLRSPLAHTRRERR
jgi:acetyl/propionyl-CoA carboxylase alpha subunit